MPRPSLRTMLQTIACLPAGAHSADPLLTAWSSTRICSEGNRLVAEGKLHKAQLAARETRYFATEALRDMFVVAHTPRRPTQPTARGLRWRANAGPRALWSADAVAFVPEGLVIQRGPSHPPRFSEHTFAFVHG